MLRPYTTVFIIFVALVPMLLYAKSFVFFSPFIPNFLLSFLSLLVFFRLLVSSLLSALLLFPSRLLAIVMRYPVIDTGRLFCPQSHRQPSWNEFEINLQCAITLRPRASSSFLYSSEIILCNHLKHNSNCVHWLSNMKKQCV